MDETKNIEMGTPEESAQTTETPAEPSWTEPSQTEPSQADAPGESQITLSESGELDISDNFWDEHPKEPARTPQTPTPEQPAAHYTPEELAEAFINGNIDETKLKPELTEYYKAINAIAQRRQEAQRQAQLRQAQLQQAQLQQAQQQTPQTQPEMSKESWARLKEVGKIVAAQRYLGIEPGAFDEYDPNHVAAQNMAMIELREQAQQMAQTQRIQQAQQDRQAQMAQQMRQQAQAKNAEIINILNDVRQKTPDVDFNEVNEKYFKEWRDNLSVKEYNGVKQIMAMGTPAQIRDLVTRVVADYRKSKGQPSSVKNAKTNAAVPPSVIKAGNAGEERKGMANVSDFGGLSPDEQVQWLIDNKFV